MYTREQSIARRDQKVREALQNAAPLWLINDDFRPVEESLIFDLVYLHSIYGWVQHRYKYDAFNDVLYHMGEMRLSETQTLTLQEQDPYFPGEISLAVPNNPQGRPSPPPPAPTRNA